MKLIRIFFGLAPAPALALAAFVGVAAPVATHAQTAAPRDHGRSGRRGAGCACAARGGKACPACRAGLRRARRRGARD